jgi:dTDP-4-dehydrorhamnose 3,5-epimerase
MEDINLIFGNSSTHFDHRGSFTPIELNSHPFSWHQSNISISDNLHTFRGLHYQTGEWAQTKLIKCVRGQIMDIVVDLRPESPGYLQAQFFELTPQNYLLIPNYYAHGFLTLQSGCIVQYLVDKPWKKDFEGTLFYNQVPKVNEYLQGKSLVISQKDDPNFSH